MNSYLPIRIEKAPIEPRWVTSFILSILRRYFFQNKILFTTVFAWAIAQSIKVVLGVVREKRFNFKWFIGTGGMPSSHAAGATALATTCGFHAGFHSIEFALAAVFAIVTMFDAQGVRRSAGQWF